MLHGNWRNILGKQFRERAVILAIFEMADINGLFHHHLDIIHQWTTHGQNQVCGESCLAINQFHTCFKIIIIMEMRCLSGACLHLHSEALADQLLGNCRGCCNTGLATTCLFNYAYFHRALVWFI